MGLKVGDKCPQCKEGLIERTELGITCSECSFEVEMPEVIAANTRTDTEADNYIWKARSFKIPGFDTPDEAEEFLRGLILARQNNNSEYFPMLIDAVNAQLEPWRAAKLRADMRARG